MESSEKSFAFLFDLDGVLIDSEKEYTGIWARINHEFPTGIDNFEVVIKGTTLKQILEKYYTDDVTRKKVADRLHELESQMLYDYKPGALEFLGKLKKNGFPAALVTSSDNKKMNHLWAQRPELKDLFDLVVTGEMVTKSKPDPEGYLLAASRLGFSPLKSIVFEDSLQGVMAGIKAGAFVVGMAGTLPGETLAPYSHIVVRNFDEIDLENLILK